MASFHQAVLLLCINFDIDNKNPILKNIKNQIQF